VAVDNAGYEAQFKKKIKVVCTGGLGFSPTLPVGES
jgi:hypothetical protein